MSVISRGVKTLICRLVDVGGGLFGWIGGGRREGFRGDCHERLSVPKGRVVGDGGRVGGDSGVSFVTDEVVVCVRWKCIGSCL